MLHAEFRVELPAGTWVARVSRAHPAATLRLLSGLRTGTTAVELGAVSADPPDPVVRDLGADEAVDDLIELARDDGTVLVRYETADTGLYAFAEAVASPLEFPVVVRDGWYVLELTGTRAAFDRVREGLEAADCRFELLSVVGERRESALLTDRQREVLTAAVRRGYFSVPRGCTLSDLAATFDADESTLSGVIRRGTERVLAAHLAGVDGGEGGRGRG